jgi:hypothetical protein
MKKVARMLRAHEELLLNWFRAKAEISSGAAVPFLANKLNVDTDDIAVRDIVLIFDMMEVTGSYNVKADASLTTVLTSKVAGMKNKAWQDMCLKVLKGRQV